MPRNDDRARKDLEILGLEISATEGDKKKAFIKLALKLHPDRFSKNPDDATKMRFHEVCKAYKRLTDHSSTADWNIDRSDEIFFSLLADSLQHNSKTALYELFSELPNHKSHFQNDNEYRIKEDVFDDEEDEDTEFNRLIKILMNRLQNGKSLPAGLTQDRICKLKEDFMKQREATKRCVDDEKSSIVGKKPKPQVQVPVTKPKPKNKKQILAEQRRREREMAKIAEELDEKKKREGERENARKQMETEKQRKMEEEQRKLEDDRKRMAQEAKKKKEREDKEREQRQQKENERLEKLKKQQEEESRRKEEEKKRKAEEKAAKSKSTRETKEREEKEKAEQAKKQQNNKRTQAPFQQQYQSQYQQQQQKYPREVPPRFLRQMMQRQQPNSNAPSDLDESQQQQAASSSSRQDGKTSIDDNDWDKDSNDLKTVEKSQASKLPWSENPPASNENWGQELSNNSGSLSDWGTVSSTEDWDAPSDSNYTDWADPSSSAANVRKDITKKDNENKSEPTPVGTIGSEMKSGKIPKMESIPMSTDNIPSATGQFGAIGQRVISSNDEQLEKKGPVSLTEKKELGTSFTDSGSSNSIVNMKIKKDLMYKDVIERNSVGPSGGQSSIVSKQNQPAGGQKVDSSIENISRKSENSSPKLTGWSGLDCFDGVPASTVSSVNDVSQDRPPEMVEPESSNVLNPENINSSGCKDIANSQTASQPQNSKEIIADKIDSKSDSSPSIETSRETDEWGWTTASSKKTKQKVTVPSSANKDANVWTSRSLKQLLDMGFKRDEAEKALKENNGIIESAVSDLLSRTDVERFKNQTSGGQSSEQVSHVLDEMTKTPKPKDQVEDGRCQISTMISSAAVTGSPDKLNRKQRRKQIQGKPSSEGRNSSEMNVSSVNKESSEMTETTSRSLPEKRTVLTEQPLDSRSNKTASLRDASQIQPPHDTNIAKTKSVGVIGRQSANLLSTSVSKFSASPNLSASSNSDVVSKDILTSLGMSVSVSAQNAPAMTQNHPQPSTQFPLSQLHLLAASGTSALAMAQGNLTSYPPDAQSTTQNARIQFILQQQLAQMRVTPSSQSHDPLLHQRQHFTPESPLLSGEGQLPGSAAKTNPSLPEPVYAPTSLPVSTAPAPQISKLHQWTQPLGRDEANPTSTSSQSDQTNVPWSTSASASDHSSSTSSVIAPVTVDPVSAKWGVLAAPRLSPTPCEFKPGVPWKPKAEQERVERGQHESGCVEEIQNQEEQTDVTIAKVVGAEKGKSVVRPPPGLNCANSFEQPSKDLETKAALREIRKTELAIDKTVESRLVSLTGLSAKVDHHSLRILCQNYGIVLSYAAGPLSAMVFFESTSQAQNACKALNDTVLFETKIKAIVVPEEDKPIVVETKGINPHQGLPTKPFLPSHYPGMPVQNFWENGQLGPINPGMNQNINANMTLAGQHPVSGLPQAGILGINPQLGLWGSGRPEQIVNSSPFWPMNTPPPQGLLSQVPGYGQWGATTSQSLTAANPTTYATVSPSASAKLLPDGLFNGSESI